MNKTLREKLLVLAYLGFSSCCLLPAFDIAFNSSELFAGIPISVLWLTCCFVALVTLAIFGYYWSFRFWSAPADGGKYGSDRH